MILSLRLLACAATLGFPTTASRPGTHLSSMHLDENDVERLLSGGGVNLDGVQAANPLPRSPNVTAWVGEARKQYNKGTFGVRQQSWAISWSIILATNR